MDFKIDMSKVVKIVVAKDDNSFIEYCIDNGTIVDVSIVSKEATIEEKVENLKQTNEDVKRISKLIEFENAGILDKMAKTGDSLFKTIKDTVVNEPIEANVIQEVKEVTDNINRDTFSDGVKDAAKIMKLQEKMDEFARANREKIAEHLFDENPNNAKARPVLDTIMDEAASNKDKKFKWEKPDFSKIAKTSDRTKRIENLKGMITNINKNKNNKRR